MLNLPSPSSGKQILRRTMEQALLPSGRHASHKDKRPAHAFLGPVHPSKVSKAAGKRKGPQRRLNILQKVSSNGLPLSSGVDAVEPQPSPTPDRVLACTKIFICSDRIIIVAAVGSHGYCYVNSSIYPKTDKWD